MKLHNAIHEFISNYDRDAISSIQDLGNIPSMSASNFLFEGVDVKKSADVFLEYLDGYSKYKISSIGNDESDTKVILERTEMFLEHVTPGGSNPTVFEFTKLHLRDTPEICTSYMESINRVIDKIDSLTTEMREAGATNEDVAALTEMGDMYVTHLQPKIEKIMDYALCASGYNNKKWIDGILNKKREPKDPSPVFL